MKTHDEGRDRYFQVMGRQLDDRGQQRLRYHMGFLYRDIEFAGKRILDVGGGTGTHSLYAASSGASHVLILEPEADGGSHGMVSKFIANRNALGHTNVEILETTFQNFSTRGGTFDIVLIQDAINHLDEPACVDLHVNKASREIYRALFHKVGSIVNPGAQLIFADCSSKNLFPALGLRNPFDPAIEWHKHQPPGVWTQLLEEVGFERVALRWSSPARFGNIGQALLGNAPSAYMFTSHFVVVMKMGNTK